MCNGVKKLKKLKNKLIIVFIFVSICNLYSLDVQSLFNVKEDGEIVYYKTESIDSEDYKKASAIKESLIKQNYKVYSVIISDILDKKGNEYIVLTGGENGKRLIIYSGEKVVFEYKIENAYEFSKSAVDLCSFFDKNNVIGIIKYYIINELPGRRNIELYMFRASGGNINLVSNIVFYEEISSGKVPVKVQMDNIFVDIDGDGIYEMIVASKENVGGQERVEYQIYKYDKKTMSYGCVMSSWLDEGINDYSQYFNN